MPAPIIASRPETKEEAIPFLFSLDDAKKQPHPEYTSFVTRNAALIVARTTNSQLQTVGDGKSRDLVTGQNKDLLEILGNDYSDQFKSPYDTVDLIRFHEALRDDGIVAACVDFLIQFIMGDHFKTVIDVNTEFDTEEESNRAREAFANNPRIKAYKARLDRLNREIKFQTHMYSLLYQCFGFGRCCGLLEKDDEEHLPIAIKVLPSMHLGQVYAHRKTWDVMAVEHLDWKFPASIIKKEDMIYFCGRNHNISPGTFQYGYSILERVVDLSELNRITNQRNLKEINYRLWAAFLLVKFPGSFDEATLKKLRDAIAQGAGNSIVVNSATTVEVHQIGHDMEKLLEQRSANYEEIIRQLQIPTMLFDPDILNRATSQEYMEVWNFAVLTVYRSWYKDMVQDQWINPILKQMIENERQAAREAQQGQPLSPQPPEDREESNGQPNVSLGSSREVIPIEAIDPRTGEVMIYRLPWRIKIELEPPNYDTYKEKAETVIMLKNNGLMTLETALKRLGVKDEAEIAALLEKEKERREERLAFGAERFQQANPQTPDPQDRNRARSIETQRENLQQDLRRTISPGNR